MAKAFLRSVAEYIYEQHKDKVEKLCIVLPNKRASLFLKTHLAQVFSKTIWLPRIISAEELIAGLSGLQTLEEIDLMGHLYESYKICYGSAAEGFDSFAKWGQLMLLDFNEIDRYLADSEQLYENLKDIKVIENWSLGEESLSEYQINYLLFMKSLGAIYKHFSAFLLSNGWAYQGLAYKQAVANLSTNAFTTGFESILFCGFNALNSAEIKIFQSLLKQKKAEVLWDADTYYLNDKNQEAGFFLRQNHELFSQTNPLFVENNLEQKKDFKIISVPRQMGQAQVVKQTLERYLKEGIAMDKVVVVLANEKLLWPVLQQLPAEIEHVNITMEYPLRYTSTYNFIEQLILIQLAFEKQKRSQKTIYYRDFISALRQPMFRFLIHGKGLRINPEDLIRVVTNRNLSFVTSANLAELMGNDFEALRAYFEPSPSVQNFCELLLITLQSLQIALMEDDSENKTNLELEYLHIFTKHFNRLSDLLLKYPHFNDIHSFRQLFTQVLGNASAPFLGEPLMGLQIMGVLETRTLDFEYIILVNANEGILPSGKSINSFIPNDLKRAFGLPLYEEKDAIYAYHFYRLIQKAKEITITYDSETDAFGKGEKSRFATQLMFELQKRCPQISITESVAAYDHFPSEIPNIISVQKNDAVLEGLLTKAKSKEKFGGLSPSGLIMYKDCPLKFYFRYGAKLKETQEVEESAEANTFGTILHLSLEKLYQPFVGKIMRVDDLDKIVPSIERKVNASFATVFGNSKPTGKSLLQQDVLEVYVNKLVASDIKFAKKLAVENHQLSLYGLEQEFITPIFINSDGNEIEIFIRGTIDRIDRFKDKVRIIDYKSSIQSSDKFTFEGFEELFRDKKCNKQLQLILYAWLLYKNKVAPAHQLIPCIIPFKVFSDVPKYILDKKRNQFLFSEDFFNEFETELKLFVEGIFDRTRAFSQTEETDMHEFCSYKNICNY